MSEASRDFAVRLCPYGDKYAHVVQIRFDFAIFVEIQCVSRWVFEVVKSPFGHPYGYPVVVRSAQLIK